MICCLFWFLYLHCQDIKGVTAGGNTPHHNWPHAAPDPCLHSVTRHLASQIKGQPADGVKYHINPHRVKSLVWVFSEHFLLSIVIHPENCSEQEKYYYLIATGCGRDERDARNLSQWSDEACLISSPRTCLGMSGQKKIIAASKVKSRRTWQYSPVWCVCGHGWCKSNKAGIHGCKQAIFHPSTDTRVGLLDSQVSGHTQGGDDERNGPRVWCLWFPVAISGYWGQLSVNIINLITPIVMITCYNEEKEEHEASNSYVKRSITISPRSEISDEVISLLLAPGPVYSRHVRHVSGKISQYQGISPSHLPSPWYVPSLTNCLDFVRWRWRCGRRLASYYSCIVSIVSINNHRPGLLTLSMSH